MPDGGAPFVSCRALSKVYVTQGGMVEALHEVDGDIELGAVTVIVGASGSGKSTLLRALAGLDHITSGSLVVGGRELAGASARELRLHRARTASYVSQRPADNLVPHLTVPELAGENGPAVAALLAAIGLGARVGSLPAQLSGGEQARAAFALALVRETQLIVADEPTAELDRRSAEELLTLIRERASAGVAIVIATHDSEVMAIADRVIQLDRGRVVTAESPPQGGAVDSPMAGGAGEVVLTAHGIVKGFRRGDEAITAVAETTVELHQGRIAALLGRSGSGKSTLLMLLAGWQRPDAGEVRYPAAPDGTGTPPWSVLAYLPQRFGLLPELTVRENVSFPARLSGAVGANAARVEELLARLGLVEFADRLPHQTSIGQQQRAALARALVLRPTILLADEPTSHQDAGWRDRIWELLVETAQAGTSCLVASHEERSARFARDVLRIDEGTVVPSSRLSQP